MALTLCESAAYNGILAFKPSSIAMAAIRRRVEAEPEMDVEEIVARVCVEISQLPKAKRTESMLAVRLADAARSLPKDMQEIFLLRATTVLETCNLVEPEPTAELSAEFLAQIQLLKIQWRQSLMRDPIQRMMQQGSWSWAHAVEAEDEFYPERKAERDARAAAAASAEAKAAAEAAAEAAARADAERMQQMRDERLIKDNRNPSLRPGNLYLGVTEQDLRKVFEPFGRLTRVNVPKCRETGNTRGFAFVDFANPEDATRAFIALNKAPRMVGNQMMRVEFASTELKSAPRGSAAAAPRRK
jgi:hypothetical protein